MLTDLHKLYKDLSDDNVSPQDSMPAVEISLARELAYRLSIPSEPVTDPVTFFRATHLPTINRVLSDLGDACPINQLDAQRLTLALWRLRYNLVHNQHADLTDLLVRVALSNDVTGCKPYLREDTLYDIPPRYQSALGTDLYRATRDRIRSCLNSFFGD